MQKQYKLDGQQEISAVEPRHPLDEQSALELDIRRRDSRRCTAGRVSRMTKTALVFAVLAYGGWASTAHAFSIIHESATLGETAQGGGASIISTQFLGSRFSVGNTVQVDAIGGHLTRLDSGNQLIFGAIVELSSPTALPTGGPSDLGEVIASTTFSPPLSNDYGGGPGSDDILVPLLATLTPGDYALVFGSGLFDATGYGVMPGNNTDLLGSSYFKWDGAGWSDLSSNQGFRFVVSGSSEPAVPEPTTLAIWSVLGGIGLLAGRWRGKRKAA